MCNYYESVVIIGRGGRQFKKIMSFLFLFLSLIFSSCQPVTDDFDGGNGSTSTSSGGKHFFTLTVRASNKRSAGDSLRATVTYEPEVTWESEQGFRSTVTDFVIKVGNEAPQTVQLGASVSSRGMYTVGSDVTVSYEAYGNVTFKNERGKTETKREVIASESKTVKVAAEGTTVNFKVSAGIKTPESYEETVADGTVKYSAGIATVGSVLGLPDEKEYAPGETVTPPAQVTWDYGNFNGWTANVDLEVTTPNGTFTVQAGDAIAAGSTFTMPDSGVLLTAQWVKKTYTIKYDANAAKSGGTATSTTMPQTESITALENATVSDVELDTVHDNINNKNYTFTGYWLTDPEGTDGKRYRAGDTIPMMGDITLYAQWSDKTMYRVTFTAPATKPASYTSGYGMPSPQNVEENTAATWTNPAAVGWTFEGWDVSDTDSTQFIETLGANITSYTPTSNVTLQAKWNVIEYTVNYVVNNGEGSGTYEQKYRITDSGGNITYYNGATFQRSGYSLTGWNYSDGTPAGTPNFASSATPLIGKAGNSTTITLYAKWEATTYTIQFDGVGASGSQNSIDFTVEDTSTTLPQTTTFTKPGEIFSHWATSSGGVSVQLSNIIAKIKDGDTNDFTMNDNTITIYAVWRGELLDTPSVGSIIMNDGSLCDASSVVGREADAIAIVYKVENGKAWAIGKVLGENLAWCVGPSASLPNGVEGYNSRFAELETNVTGSGQDLTTYSFSGYEDGSTGFDILKGGVTDYSNGNGNYPAWEFCESYGTTNCAGTNFTSGWYLPSLVEVRDIALVVSDEYSSTSDVADALTSVDSGTYTSAPPFWYLKVPGLLSSSTVSPGDSSGINGNAYFLLLQPGANVGNATSDKLGAIVKDDTSKCVWAVRQFTY